MIDCKDASEIKRMHEGGKKLATILKTITNHIKPGISTQSLDDLAYKLIIQAGGKPSFLHYQGYPASVCVSVNDEVVHGIPSQRIFRLGDIVGIDIGIKYKGLHTDMARTLGIGKISKENQTLIDITKKALEVGIKSVKPNIHLGDVSHAIEKVINAADMGIIRELSGHGIGKRLQEPPSVPNFGIKNKGPILKPGMTLALEPMVTLGKPEIRILSDQWTIVTADGLPSAHFEDTVAVTDQGAQILTR